MQSALAYSETIAAAEPIVRFVAKKLTFDELHSYSASSSRDLERAAARAAVEAAAWSISVMPETAAILAASPAVRAAVMQLLDLEYEELDETSPEHENSHARFEFAASVRHNAQLYAALNELAPDSADIVDRLVSTRH